MLQGQALQLALLPLMHKELVLEQAQALQERKLTHLQDSEVSEGWADSTPSWAEWVALEELLEPQPLIQDHQENALLLNYSKLRRWDSQMKKQSCKF